MYVSYSIDIVIYVLLGKRPVVFFRLKISDYLDATEGYDEDEANDDSKSKDRSKLGKNILVDWDKNSDLVGESTLHITEEYDILMKVYLKKRLHHFGEEQLFREGKLNMNQFFFVTSNKTQFQVLDLAHTKIEEGSFKKIKPFDHRKKVSSWAQNHSDKEIVESESSALNHSNKVADKHYLLNKERKPQRLVKQYAKESEVYPHKIVDSINEAEEREKGSLDEQETIGKEIRMKSLLKHCADKKTLRRECQDLGPRRRILHKDCVQFVELVEEFKGKGVLQEMSNWKPRKWRDYIVRLVCTKEGERGDQLRELWKAVYRGDLKWGVREARSQAAAKNFPPVGGITSKRDRNSWVAAYLKKYVTTILPK